MDIAHVRGRVDFGIITIREDEYDAVLARFPKVETVSGRRRYRIRSLALPGGESYTIAVVRCVEQGTTDALSAARDLLEDLDPAWLLVVGIAGGVPASEFTLGDVVVSTRIADFSVEAVLQDHAREYALAGGPLHPEAASSVPFLAIRGISDVVGHKRHPDWTAYACHTAAAFTRARCCSRGRSHRAAASEPSPPR